MANSANYGKLKVKSSTTEDLTRSLEDGLCLDGIGSCELADVQEEQAEVTGGE